MTAPGWAPIDRGGHQASRFPKSAMEIVMTDATPLGGTGEATPVLHSTATGAQPNSEDTQGARENAWADTEPNMDDPASSWSLIVGDPAAQPPVGHRLDQSGLSLCAEEGGEGDLWLCSPLAVRMRACDSSEQRWSREIVLQNGNGRHRSFLLPDALLDSPRMVKRELRNHGVKLSSDPKAFKALLALLSAWETPKRALIVDQLGWIDRRCETYVANPNLLIGAGEQLLLSDRASEASISQRSCSGELEDWRRNVAMRCLGNPLLIVAVSLAFAGALLEPLGLESRGIHFRGRTSSGKSTIMRAAVSVWGAPSFMQTWRATSSGLELVAQSSNGSLLALDELAEVEANEVEKIVYMLANGSGRIRANQGARPLRWKTALLSTGELSIAEKMGETGRKPRGGLDVRLLDVSADDRSFGAFDDLHDAKSPAAFAETLKRATGLHYGSAGPAFVEQIVSRSRQKDLRTEFERFGGKLRTDLTKMLGLSQIGESARVLDLLALIVYAGELAALGKITGWPQRAALSAVADLASGWAGARMRPVTQAIDNTRNFLSANLQRFELESESLQSSNRMGWADANYFYVPRTVWAMIHAGEREKASLGWLDQAGYLWRDGNHFDRRPPAWCRQRMSDPEQRLYNIRRTILTEGSDSVVISSA